MKTGYLFILSGPSGSGKTTLIKEICQNSEKNVIAPKYSTRSRRQGFDDIISVENIEVGPYDIVYALNERRYGIKAHEIIKIINSGKNAFIVLSDFRIIRRVKSIFPECSKAIFISSPINRQKLIAIHSKRHSDIFHPTNSDVFSSLFQQLNSASRLGNWQKVNDLIINTLDAWKNIFPEADSIDVRAAKIQTLHIRYVDNIDLFDHVILNYTTIEDMVAQMRNILSAYENNFLPQKQKKYPIIYIVAAASGSGKGTLMEALNTIGKDRIQTIKKYAKREPKKNDKRDGMIAIGSDGNFPHDFDFRWKFHKGEIFSGVEYAVSTKYIKNNLKKNIHQIVISNIQQFDNWLKFFNEHIVFLYLHSTRSLDDVKTYQYNNCKTKEEAEERISEYKRLHKDYIKHIAYFNHVLLNTSFIEDLYDQMFRLIEFYQETSSI